MPSYCFFIFLRNSDWYIRQNFNLTRDHPTSALLLNFQTNDDSFHVLWYSRNSAFFRLKLGFWTSISHLKWLYLHFTLHPICTHVQISDHIWKRGINSQNIYWKITWICLLLLQCKVLILIIQFLKIIYNRGSLVCCYKSQLTRIFCKVLLQNKINSWAIT